jgi:hypothetical protein
MARAARATSSMATAMRVVGNIKSNGEGSKGNGNDTKDVGHGTAMVTMRATATATRVVGEEEVNGGKSDDC